MHFFPKKHEDKKIPKYHTLSNSLKGMSINEEIEKLDVLRESTLALKRLADELEVDEDIHQVCGGQPLPDSPEEPEQDEPSFVMEQTPPRAAKKPRVVDPVDLEGFFNELNTEIGDRVTICRNYARYLVSTMPKTPKAPRKQKK